MISGKILKNAKIRCANSRNKKLKLPFSLLNQYSTVLRARSSIAGKDATRNASTDLCRLIETFFTNAISSLESVEIFKKSS